MADDKSTSMGESKSVETILESTGLLEDIEKVKKYVAEIEELHYKLLVGDDKEKSTSDKINSLHWDVLGFKETIKSFLGEATTVGLTMEFTARVNQYRQSREIWEKRLGIMVPCVVVAYIVILLLLQPTTLADVPLYLIRVVPFFVLIIWAVTFLLNRRSESKKLEESYKHKETVAKLFEGYKESIKKDVSHDNHDNLRSLLMENLLRAISKDSSEFLTSKGEQHPTTATLKKSLTE